MRSGKFNEELRKRIRGMTKGQGIYKVLKEELLELGYWKNKKRGSSERWFEVMKERRGGKREGAILQ